jgi:hypothetical protein
MQTARRFTLPELLRRTDEALQFTPRLLVFNDLPSINQRGLLIAEIHLQLYAVTVSDDRANGGILYLSVVQVHADEITYLEFTFRFFGSHARTVRWKEESCKAGAGRGRGLPSDIPRPDRPLTALVIF